MAKANPTAEPSMEEILASIRRIISDDGAAESKPAEGSKPAASAGAEDAPAEEHVSEEDLDRLFAQAGSDDEDGEAADVLELDDAMAADDGPEVVEGMVPEEADITFADPAPPGSRATGPKAPEMVEPEPELSWDPPASEPRPDPRPETARQASRGPSGTAAVDDDAEPLVSPTTGASVNAAFGQLTHTILAANAKTLDDIVKEMLRPMLKSWLDENLPVVVERLVRAEIERVSRGR